MASEAREETRPNRLGWGRWVLGVFVVLLLAVGFFVVRTFGRPAAERARPVADVASERLLPDGPVVGFAAEFETHAWLGIPFAQPPLGEQRWRAPQPPEPWIDTLDALEFGSPCLQLTSRLAGIPADDAAGFGGSEDCLTLNIWAPRGGEGGESSSRRLPVMVWIHGGGNTRGAASLSMYDGARLAGTQGVVVVTVQYRLGPLGWFSHPALRVEAQSPLEASGNFGTLDQIRALEWVQANIDEFGGDASNVTIFGESAGGTNVLSLLLADAATGLFHRAIAQSGSTDSVSRRGAEAVGTADAPSHPHHSAAIAASLIASAGVVPEAEAAQGYAEALAAEDLVELMRSRPAREVLDAYRDPKNRGSLDVPNPIRDGVLLPEGEWLERLRTGGFHKVPIMLGINRDEQRLFLSQDEAHVRRRFGLLYRIRDRADYARRGRLKSDLWALRGVVRPARAVIESGWGEVYAYRFDWDGLPSVLGQEMSELIGAGHGFEIPFLFGTFDIGDPLLSRLLYPPEGQAEREALSASMMAFWAEFARTGRPTSAQAPVHWLPWSEAGGQDHPGRWLVLDEPADGGIRLERTRLSRERVIAAVDADADLDRNARCALFWDLFQARPDWDPRELSQIGREGCPGTPKISE